MNLRAALEPQGSFRGRSNVLPKSTSSAEIGRRKRPIHIVPHHQHSRLDREWDGHDTLNLNAPSDALAVLSVEVFAVQDGPVFVGEVLDVRENPAFECVRCNGMRVIGIDGDGHKRV